MIVVLMHLVIHTLDECTHMCVCAPIHSYQGHFHGTRFSSLCTTWPLLRLRGRDTATTRSLSYPSTVFPAVGRAPSHNFSGQPWGIWHCSRSPPRTTHLCFSGLRLATERAPTIPVPLFSHSWCFRTGRAGPATVLSPQTCSTMFLARTGNPRTFM